MDTLNYRRNHDDRFPNRRMNMILELVDFLPAGKARRQILSLSSPGSRGKRVNISRGLS
jgi:hypothetical protein